MLSKRILTAVIGIPIAIYIINFGQWLFTLSIVLLALIAWQEYYAMMRYKGVQISYLVGLAGTGLLLGCAAFGNSQELVFTIMLMLVLSISTIITSCTKVTIADGAFTFLGIIYIGLSFSHLIMLRFTDNLTTVISPIADLPAGAFYIWLAFIGTWASDTFAYFVGLKFGRTKLCPAISPAKTREGAIGGLIGCILAIGLAGSLFKLPLLHSATIGLLVGIAAPLGDLVESAIKRYAGVKDSGKLLPGHGGVLDRFDSIMFTVPTVYYYVYAFIYQ